MLEGNGEIDKIYTRDMVDEDKILCNGVWDVQRFVEFHMRWM